MKKLTLLCTAVLILCFFTSCANSKTPVSQKEAENAYKAARMAYDWFDSTAPISTDASKSFKKKVLGKTYTYSLVNYEGVTSLENLRAILEKSFTKDYAAKLLEKADGYPFVEKKGSLYTVSDVRTADPKAGKETYSMVAIDDKSTYFKVDVEMLDDAGTVVALHEYSFKLVKTDEGWRFADFGAVR